MSAVAHGGDLAAATAAFGAPPDGWVDLSTGINPWPWPVGGAVMETARRLPDSGLLARLREEAARAYGASGPAFVAPAPGTQALVQWLPRLRPACRVTVVAPTYAEHARSWRAAGHRVALREDLPDPGDADVVVLTRPNNPDGRIADRGEVLALAGALGERGGRVVVDEAFADVAAGLSLIPDSPPGMTVLRSFGKFFGLPGLRLGFAVAEPETAAALRDALGPWPVSSVAAETAAAALGDAAWRERTRHRLAAAAERLDAVLETAGLEVAGGTTLFRHCRHDRAQDLHARLARAGILVRRFPEEKRFLRVGLPGPEAHWRRLERALAS